MRALLLTALLVQAFPASALPVRRVPAVPARVGLASPVRAGLPAGLPSSTIPPALAVPDAPRPAEALQAPTALESATAAAAVRPAQARSGEGASAASDFSAPAIHRPSQAHGLPGRLIVVEGLDGSGKSTQLERLQKGLRARGHDVVVTTWNSSELMSGAVRRAKREKTLAPRPFALANAVDLADRLEKTILPALRAGKVVLADRWVYTALARDHARGMDRDWLRRLYEFAPRPDAVLFFRVPVEEAVRRVLDRSGRPSLSEDGEEARPGAPKHYEAGLDVVHGSADPVTNFVAFQTRVAAEYDRLAKRLGFHVLDGLKDRGALSAEVRGRVDALDLPPASASPAPAAGTFFDRDPAADPEDLRARFSHPELGLEDFLRKACKKVLQRYMDLLGAAALDAAPKAWLHGNPNMGNFMRTERGSALNDFDRTRRGPYSWDVTRFLTDVGALYAARGGRLPEAVSSAFETGYLLGVRHPNLGLQQPRKLLEKQPKKSQSSVRRYAEKGKGVTGAMRENPIENPRDDAWLASLLRGYLERAGRADVLERFKIAEAGYDQGERIGNRARDRVIVLLKPKDKESKEDWILLGFKMTRADDYADMDVGRWFADGFSTHGERMEAADRIYSTPGGWPIVPVTVDGVEFYGREMPVFSAKYQGKVLSAEELEELAFVIGAQLGRGHVQTAEGGAALLEEAFKADYPRLREVAERIVAEAIPAHRRYLAALASASPAPAGSGDE